MKHIRFITLLLVCVFLASCFSACFPKVNVTMEGGYSLKQALQDGIDVTEDFLLYQVSFDGAEMKVVINYMNMLISRNSTYKATAEQVVETYQGDKRKVQHFLYCLSESCHTLQAAPMRPRIVFTSL